MNIDFTVAWTGTPDGFREITINTVNGEPILPENSTIVPQPKEVTGGHFLTIENGKWVEKLINPSRSTLEEYRSSLLIRLENWRQPFMEAPVKLANGYIVDNKQRTVNLIMNCLSEFNWFGKTAIDKFVCADNQVVLEPNKEFLSETYMLLSTTNQSRFDQVQEVKKAIQNAGTIEDLDSIVFPTIDTVESLKNS